MPQHVLRRNKSASYNLDVDNVVTIPVDFELKGSFFYIAAELKGVKLEIQKIEVSENNEERIITQQIRELVSPDGKMRLPSVILRDFLHANDSDMPSVLVIVAVDVMEDEQGHSRHTGFALNGIELTAFLGVPTSVLPSGMHGAKLLAKKTINDMRLTNCDEIKNAPILRDSALACTQDVSSDKAIAVMSEQWLRSAVTSCLTPQEHKSLIDELMDSQRISIPVAVENITRVNLERFKKQGILSQEEHSAMKGFVSGLTERIFEKRGKRKVPPHLLMINATELGGGVAEMRPDTAMILRDLGVQCDWAVIDGCGPFYGTTVHIHEGIQNPAYSPIDGKDFEILQLVTIHNFNRMHNEKVFENVDIIWIDDPQPMGMLPLIRVIHPNITVMWRCHIHADPQPVIKKYVSDVVQGHLDIHRDHLWFAYLTELGYDVQSLRAVDFRAHGAVFHQQSFADGLGLTEVPVFLQGPAVNPMAFKNLPLRRDFVNATLHKFGVVNAPEEKAIIPLIVMQVSRYDPYKGPFETLVAFINAMKVLADDGDPKLKEMSEATHFIYAANVPPDNPSGVRMHRLMCELSETILNDLKKDVADSLRSRIHILSLEDKRREEYLMERISALEGFRADRAAKAHLEIMEWRDSSISEMLEGLLHVGMISEKTAKIVSEEIDPEGVVFTPEQTAFAHKTFVDNRRTRLTQHRAETNVLSGREMNHLEINAIQSAAIARLQFSSKEGFGLVVSEAMLKHSSSLPSGVMIASCVGGIQSQVNDKTQGISLQYPPNEVADSLAMYIDLPDSINQSLGRDLYQRMIGRSSVQGAINGIVQVMRMPDEERDTYNVVARRHVLENFSTHANVFNILKAVSKAMSS